MRYLQIFVLLAVVLAIPFVASAAVLDNVALNGNVSLIGTFFQGGWGAGLTVQANTIVDGSFLARSTQWDQGAVWWDSTGQNTGQFIFIDLGDVYEISKFIVQADDNDEYGLFFWNSIVGWSEIWHIPAVGGVGMQTRPDPADNTRTFHLASPIVTTYLAIEGDYFNSDRLFSVSEVQAFGHKVPEPATMLLFGAGLAGIWSFRKKIK